MTPASPLVSCVMPTCRRPHFVRQAIRLFAAQDYPTRELIIVGDQMSGVFPPGVRFLEANGGETIGAKRNRACAAAKGEFIALWDDDDWYGPQRLSAQLAPLIDGDADISALTASLFFDVHSWTFWRVSPTLHRRMFLQDVAAGTLVFRRTLWGGSVRFPDASLAEDAGFVASALRRKSRLARVDGSGLFMYVRHGHNSWNFQCGNGDGWRVADEPRFSSADRHFYSKIRESEHPLVTCIMPTGARRSFVRRALTYFLRQSYEPRELVIIDDGETPVQDLAATDDRVRYVRLRHPIPLGEKRNQACELARGDIIAHWDDDDWYPADRLGTQIARLHRHGAEVCGPRRVRFYAPARNQCWRYVYPQNAHRPWVAGSGLCYTRDAWRAHPFDSVTTGEDIRFVRSHASNTVFCDNDDALLVAILHEDNSHPKATRSMGWQPRPLHEIRGLLGDDWDSYASLQRT
ncbi:glycosyltransferase family 2 protein [Mycolicibacterium holsaticum]|uniref:Glycosyltransferase 2-like domain-containing protein n=1 Tax=Mycolicibacterium holsaticum TaxID=152142 RepID=A0A1E3RXZ6_9MYCO|nr:glycosyltransferase family A protein [Mycolicibacterium holsaticum]ODQ94719.1 hypothetical protein BHQ17_07945 [Mycolicibacterium holsaticum]